MSRSSAQATRWVAQYIVRPPTPDQPFHERVRNTLAEHNISGRRFARLVGISQPLMSLVLHGKRPSAEVATRIEDALTRLPPKWRRRP